LNASDAARREPGEKGARTRRRLLDAAERVFAELGYHDASIVKITEAAGVAQGTFYLYFTGKQEIFDVLWATPAASVIFTIDASW
jgi:AcrR family transcriptional regulator